MISSSLKVGTHTVAYYASAPIATVCDRVIFGIHGNGREAVGLYDTLMAATPSSMRGRVLVIVPRWLTPDDSPTSSRHVWTSSGWKYGDLSTNGAVSSFAVLDVLAARATGAKYKVVAGHSAGGQFVNRYAAGSPGHVNHYVIANAGSYLYLDRRRWINGEFQLLTATACPKANTYRYGLDGLNPYMRAAGPDLLRSRYLARSIRLLLGELDTFNEGDMDTSCAAMLQGVNRRERGTMYQRHITSIGTGPHYTKTVPGVGHSSSAMWRSPLGVSMVYG